MTRTTATSLKRQQYDNRHNPVDMEGDGIVDWLKSKFQPVFNPTLRNPTINPPAVRKFLDIHGTEQVFSLQAKRVPVEQAVQSLLNIVSLGALKKAIDNVGYDAIFHLSIVVNGKYELDKREVITQRPYQKQAKEELMDIPLNNQSFNIREMLDNTARVMGNEYGNYDPQTNNCQDWIMGILRANNIGNNDVFKFVKQDALKIFQGLPSFAQKFAKFVSGKFAPAINRLLQGEGIENASPTPRQNLLKKMAEIEGKEYKPRRTKQERKLMTDKVAKDLMLKLNAESF